MEICVAGWYFEPELFPVLAAVKEKFPVTIITDYYRTIEAKKEFDVVVQSGIDRVSVPLPGLEWPKYDYYIKNIWRGGPVLFMHDDIRISDKSFFDKVSALESDQAYIFQTEEKGGHNQHFHGRGIYCSARFIRAMLDYRCRCAHCTDQPDRHNAGGTLPGMGIHSGFWFDPWNTNHNSGKPPVGIRHYNDGIYHFSLYCKRASSGTLPGGCAEKMKSNDLVYMIEFNHGKRGAF